MLKLYIKEIVRDLENAEKKRLIEAAKHVKNRLKENVAQLHPKISGDLQKGIDYMPLEHAVLVGYGPPAYHAHLLEFGTVERTVKNYRGKSGVQVKVGHVKPTPVIFPTFEQEAGEVERILNRQWA